MMGRHGQIKTVETLTTYLDVLTDQMNIINYVDVTKAIGHAQMDRDVFGKYQRVMGLLNVKMDQMKI